MFKNPFSFKGRIRRSEYFLSHFIGVIYIYIGMFIVALSSSYSYDDHVNTGVLEFFIIWTIFYLWFILAQNTKRCHDLGKSGWWQLVPFYGLWMAFADGQPGPNKYGPNPKEQAIIDYNSTQENPGTTQNLKNTSPGYSFRKPENSGEYKDGELYR